MAGSGEFEIEWKGKRTEGKKPKVGSTVEVHCTGTIQRTGKKFWSTKDPGQSTFSFEIGKGKVIKAWDRGVMEMAEGETAVLQAPPHLAYGDGGFPAWGIGGGDTLIFEIELLKVT